MKIETKLNIGDECYVIYDNKIIKSKISNIKIDINWRKEIYVTYWIKNGEQFSEDFVFITKEEVLKFLEKTIKEM